MNFPRPPWWVYIVRCSDGSLYTGCTGDVGRRIRDHNHGTAGVKYTRTRRPVTLVASAMVKDRSGALTIEYEVRQAPAAHKPARLAALTGNRLHDILAASEAE